MSFVQHRKHFELALVIAFSLAGAAGPAAQAQNPAGSLGGGKRPTAAAAERQLLTRVYRIDDLILPSPNYPFRGTWLPELTDGREQPSGGGAGLFRKHKRAKTGGMAGGMMGGGMGGMMGPGGGMMGGGMPGGGMMGGGDDAAGGGAGMMMGGAMAQAGPEHEPRGGGNAFTLDIDDLMEAISTFIEPASWTAHSPDATGMGLLGNSLVIRQTAEAHKQIEAFLEALRTENSATQTVTVEAHWLLLDGKQLDTYKKAIAAGEPIGEDRDSDAAHVEESNEPYRGQVTCFNGQTVHIVSGRLQTVLQGGIPVVSGAGAVGYQPTMITPHVGALLEITPTLLPGGKAAIINVQSSVTRWDTPGPAVELAPSGGSGTSNEAGPGNERGSGPSGAGAGLGGPGEAGPGGSANSGGKGPSGGIGGMSFMMGGMGASMSGNASRPVQVDRINVVAQQLATSLRVTLGKPVLVGGMTFPGAQEGRSTNSQLYLVVKISREE